MMKIIQNTQTYPSTTSDSFNPTPEELAQIHNNEDFLKLCLAKNPKHTAIPIYLELTKKLDIEDTRPNIYQIFNEWDFDFDEPITLVQKQWLESKSELFDLIHRLCEKDGLPLISENESLQDPDRYYLYSAHDTYLKCILLLRHHARMMYQQKEYQFVSDDINCMLRLFCVLGIKDYELAWWCLRNMCNYIRPFMIADLPPEQLTEILSYFEKFQFTLFASDPLTRCLKTEYLRMRRKYVHEMSGNTWRSPVYGWNPRSRLLQYIKPESIFMVFESIHNKINATKALADYDITWGIVIENSEKGIPPSQIHISPLEL